MFQRLIRHYLWQLRPYFRQVAGELVLGSIAGIVMNTAIVLPAILLGRAIDIALALERGQASTRDVGWATLALSAGAVRAMSAMSKLPIGSFAPAA